VRAQAFLEQNGGGLRTSVGEVDPEQRAVAPDLGAPLGRDQPGPLVTAFHHANLPYHDDRFLMSQSVEVRVDEAG
jgi:hypothetical protein